jgi:hypothetical protein
MAPANQQANAIQSLSMSSPARPSMGRKCPSDTPRVNEHVCIGVMNQMNPSSAQSCSQPRSMSVRANSLFVLKQGNNWQMNIRQMSGHPTPIKSLQLNTQGQRLTGPVLLVLFDANQQRIGPYTAQLGTGNLLVFHGLPFTPISAAQLQFPNGAQPNNYVADLVICPQTANPSAPSS